MESSSPGEARAKLGVQEESPGDPTCIPRPGSTEAGSSVPIPLLCRGLIYVFALVKRSPERIIPTTGMNALLMLTWAWGQAVRWLFGGSPLGPQFLIYGQPHRVQPLLGLPENPSPPTVSPPLPPQPPQGLLSMEPTDR